MGGMWELRRERVWERQRRASEEFDLESERRVDFLICWLW